MIRYDTVFYPHGNRLYILYKVTYPKTTTFYVPTEVTVSPTISTVHLLGHFPRQLPSRFDPTPYSTPVKWFSDVTGAPHLYLFKELYYSLGLLKSHSKSDYIIVGGGIAGLYAAWKLKDQGSVTVFERDQLLGGRIKEVMFGGIPVKTGAGVGRLRKDTRLVELMKHFGFPITTIKTHPTYRFTPTVDLKQTLKVIRRAVKHIPNLQTLSFKEAATHILGKKTYEDFQSTTGYTDYEDANIMEALQHYGFDDLFPKTPFFMVPWTQLIEALTAEILSANPHNRILTDAKVTSIDTSNQTIDHTVSAPLTYKTKLFLALPFTPLKRLLSPQQFADIHKVIAPQSFLRIYAVTSPPPINNTSTIITPLPLRKISQIKDNITLIAYCDNEDAETLKKASIRQLQHLWESATGRTDKLKKLLRIYWPEGTHYNKILMTSEYLYSLQSSVHPNVALIGEMFSINQGWVHGALESVDRMIHI